MTNWFWWEHFFYAIVNSTILALVIAIWWHVGVSTRRDVRHDRDRLDERDRG